MMAEIMRYNASGKPWKCVHNCVACKLPYCVQEDIHECRKEGERRGRPKVPVYVVYGKAKVMFDSITEAEKCLGVPPGVFGNYAKKGKEYKKFGIRIEYV